MKEEINNRDIADHLAQRNSQDAIDMEKRLSNRVFTDHGEYFSIVEDSVWLEKYDKESGKLIRKECVGWSKTHLIITHACIKSEHGNDDGLQILRFHSKDKENWEPASNPYAGVYLNKDEWKKLFKKINK